ncbi:hypothetical protein Tco_0614295, partial [Tanacetum coccineum]
GDVGLEYSDGGVGDDGGGCTGGRDVGVG